MSLIGRINDLAARVANEFNTVREEIGDVEDALDAHTHPIEDIINLQATLDSKATADHTHAASDVTSGTFTIARLPVAASGTSSATQVVRADDSRLSNARTPIAHTHAIADITGLQTILDGKASASHVHGASQITSGTFDIARIPTGTTGTTVALGDHTHTPASIGAAPAGHTHAIADITNLQSTLDGKASSSHTHTAASITSGTFDISRIPVASSGVSSTSQVVRADDARLYDSRPPTAHTHTVSEISATGTPSASTYLRGDGTWTTPTNTTYSTMTQAEAENSASTVARLTTGQRLYQAIAKHARLSTWDPSWAEVSGKPATFPPETHAHTEYITRQLVTGETVEGRDLVSIEVNTSGVNDVRIDTNIPLSTTSYVRIELEGYASDGFTEHVSIDSSLHIAIEDGIVVSFDTTHRGTPLYLTTNRKISTETLSIYAFIPASEKYLAVKKTLVGPNASVGWLDSWVAHTGGSADYDSTTVGTPVDPMPTKMENTMGGREVLYTIHQTGSIYLSATQGSVFRLTPLGPCSILGIINIPNDLKASTFKIVVDQASTAYPVDFPMVTSWSGPPYEENPSTVSVVYLMTIDNGLTWHAWVAGSSTEPVSWTDITDKPTTIPTGTGSLALYGTNTLNNFHFSNISVQDGDYIQYDGYSSAWYPARPPRVPAGVINMYAGTSAPSGWLLCNGAAISRTTYADLFAVLGTTYGAGNGSTTFNLPNFSDRKPQGPGLFGSLGSTGGSFDATLTISNLPAHTHGSGTLTTSSAGSHTHGLSMSSSGSAGKPQRGSGNETASGGTGVLPSGDHTHNVTGSTSSAGTGQPFSILDPYLTINFIIKT